MISYSFNEQIRKDMSEGKVTIKDIHINDSGAMMVTAQNEKDQKVLQLRVANPQATSLDVDLSGARITELSVKQYKNLYRTKYFEVVAMAIKDKDDKESILVNGGKK